VWNCAYIILDYYNLTTDVSIQVIKNALAYSIQKFLVTVRDYRPTQFRFGRLKYVKGVIIRFHSIRPQSASASKKLSALSGLYSFENAGDHRYLVTDLKVDTRGFVKSRPVMPCIDYHCFRGKLDEPNT